MNTQDFKEVQYDTTLDGGVLCPKCKSHVEWALIYGWQKVGVCICPATGWFIDRLGKIWRWTPLQDPGLKALSDKIMETEQK